MKPIKVYLQYPWKFPDSPYYKYLIQNPPKGIEYLNISHQKGAMTNKSFFWLSNFLKRNIREVMNLFSLSIPNSYLSPKGDYDLIHCAHCLSRNRDKPWVADIEREWGIYIGEKNERVKKEVKKILENKNCKKILPWTQATASEIIANFPEIKNKVEVVYPAIPAFQIFKKPFIKKIYLLFSSRYFYEKGGLLALKIINELTKKHFGVYGIFVSQVPKEVLAKYKENKKIEFYNLMPQKELFRLYQKADILIYPGFSDSFGFAFLEAMAFGLPIITVDGYARDEIVTEEKTGFIIKNKSVFWKGREPVVLDEDKVIEEAILKTEILLNNNILLKKMSKNCLEEIKNGKFSIKERNKKLKRIYEEALK